jgi:hypothetical protein
MEAPMVVEEVIPDLQKQSFFLDFTGYLREQCSTGPEVTRLDRVASTAAHQAATPEAIWTTYPQRRLDRNRECTSKSK